MHALKFVNNLHQFSAVLPFIRNTITNTGIKHAQFINLQNLLTFFFVIVLGYFFKNRFYPFTLCFDEIIIKFNYRIMEAKGKGHFCGCNLNIDNRTFMPWFVNWPGEGDDMIFIDDDIEKGIPTLYGTGTEDYVNQAFCPTETQSAPYHGTIKPGGLNWWGKITYYRYHIEDPIYFNKHIIATIEHGHDNHRADDWSSTAYWYQTEPHDHSIWPKLLNRKGRRPKGISWPHMTRKSICILLILLWIYFRLYLVYIAPFLGF